MVKEGVMWMTIAVGWKTYFIVRVKGMKMSGVDEYNIIRGEEGIESPGSQPTQSYEFNPGCCSKVYFRHFLVECHVRAHLEQQPLCLLDSRQIIYT